MSRKKMIALLVAGWVMALGLNCIPNIGSAFNLTTLFGTAA